MVLFLFLPLMLISCSYFKRAEIVISVGDVNFSKDYYSKRFVEKLKNLDGLHVKDPAVTQSLSSALKKELIVEGFLYSWAVHQKIHISREEVLSYLREYLSSTQGIQDDFLFEAQPSKNLLEDAVKIQLIRGRLMTLLDAKIEVPDPEIEAHYRQNQKLYQDKKIKLDQIFLEKEADAEVILKSLHQAPGSFENLAKKYSLSPEGKHGGHLGWVPAQNNSHLEPLFNAPLGLSLRIYKSPQGYHIYKVIEVKKGAVQPLNAVKAQVIRDIKSQKLEAAYLLWLEEQVKTVSVKTNEGLIQSLNPSYQETL